MGTCASKDLTFADNYLSCTKCGWRIAKGNNQTISDLVEEVGSLHIHDWPSTAIGRYRIIERVLKESVLDAA